ncbi:MAG: DUF3352 domain-containing protein [Deltaproteobacteria bacterium]|jgi:hypothetical protein|nr:DUF3352 domain-containing protein [Deltaproteobacteria bacterium]
MKKVVILIVVLGLVAIGTSYFLKTAHKEVKPAKLLPADTLLMVELVNLEKSIDSFKSGKLGQKLNEIDLTGVMQNLEVPIKAIEEYEKTKSAVLSTLDSMLFKELFGQETVLAILPLKIDHLTPEGLKKALGSLVLISRPKSSAELVEFVNQILTKNLKFQTEVYAGYEIKSFELDYDITVHYSLADGLLVATLDRQAIITCLDLRKNQQPSLDQNEYYQNLRSKLASSGTKTFVYNNTKKMYESILNVSRLIIKEEEFSDMERSSAAFKGLKAIGYASYDDGSDLLQNRILVMIDKKGLEPVYAKAYCSKPGENKTLQFVPDNTLVYYWANNLYLKSFWDIYFENQYLNDEEKESMKTSLEKEIGVGFDEVFQAFGNQFGLILTDINAGGLFPIPKLTFFVEIANQDTVAKLMDSVTQKSGMVLQKEEFNDIKINYIILPFGNDVQPAYAFFNGFCIVSINHQLIKDIISTYKNGDNITTDKDFLAVNKGLTDKNNNIMFVKFDQLIDKIKELVIFGRNMMVLKDQGKAEKTAIVISGVINPALDGLKMYRTIGSRTFTKEGEIEADIYYKIDR